MAQRLTRFVILGLLGSTLAACDPGSSRKGRARDDESEEEGPKESSRKTRERDSKRPREPGEERPQRSSPQAPPVVVALPTVSPLTTEFPAPIPPPLLPSPSISPPPVPVEPPPFVAPSEDRARTRRWVVEVALGAEFAGTGDWHQEVARRWTKPVRVSVMRGDEAIRADLRAVVSSLDDVVRPLGVPVTLVGDRDATAELQVHYARSDDLPAIAQANGFAHLPGNAGFFYRVWNARGELQRAYVLLATDLLSGASLRHFTFEEVTQAMGLANDSPLYRDSVFYALGADGGDATELTARDRKLLAFLYAHVKPGQGRAQVEAAFDAHWQ